MLKLREAFSQKIHLHIRQDMLQRLWDKYVPSDSAEYGDIQLIYLGQQTAQWGEQSQKIQLLISLVLRNRIMRMELDKAPIKTALVREQMKSSSQRMEKYYLMQLKCCDFVMFRKVNRYVELLARTEADDRRFRNWQKENQAIEKQREEYRIFSLFSSEIREFLKERSFEAMCAIERELLYALSEKEYQKLAENLIWQERETFLSCLEKCDKLQCNKIIKRLEKSNKELSIKLFQSWVKGQEIRQFQIQNPMQDVEGFEVENRIQDVEGFEVENRIQDVGGFEVENRIQDVEGFEVENRIQDVGGFEVENRIQDVEGFEVKNRIQDVEGFEVENRIQDVEGFQVQNTVQDMEASEVQSAGKEFAEIARALDSHEYMLFYLRAVSVVNASDADRQLVVWKKKKQKMLRYVKRQRMSVIRQLLAQMERLAVHKEEEEETAVGSDRSAAQFLAVFSEKFIQLEEQYFQEAIKEFQQQVVSLLDSRTYQKIAQRADFLREEWAETGRLTQAGIRQIAERIEQEVKSWEEQLEQREAQAFVIYQNAYREVLGTVNIVKQNPEIQLSDTEEIPNAEKMQTLISYLQGLEEKKQSQFIESLAEAITIWRQVDKGFVAQGRGDMLQVSEELFRNRYKDRLPEKEIKEILESFELSWHSGSQETQNAEKIQELLSYLHGLESKEWPESAKILNVPYSKLWEWGKALLFHQSLQISDRHLEEGFYHAEHALAGESQTDIIRRQIEAAKDRNSLQQLITQINHNVISQPNMQKSISQVSQPEMETEPSQVSQPEMETEPSQVSQLEVPEDILVYADGLLHVPPVRELIHYLQELDEKQYGILVKELSRITKFQWQQNFAKEPEEDITVRLPGEDKAIYPQKAELAYLQTEGYMEAEPSHVAARQRQDSRQLAAAYPKLALRIQEFERQKGRDLWGNVLTPNEANQPDYKTDTGSSREMQTVMGSSREMQMIMGTNQEIRTVMGTSQEIQTVMGSSREMQTVIGSSQEVQMIMGTSQEIQTVMGSSREMQTVMGSSREMQTVMGSSRAWELQYSVQAGHTSGEEMQGFDMRMREQTMQMKSAQEQLGRKLQEVEMQLKKVETAAKDKGDVRAFADQVKRQLYEELHVEKLRRGLI